VQRVGALCDPRPIYAQASFNYLGVARLGAARATPLINSSPLFTTILALVFLREQITLKILLGVLCIVAGITVLTRQRRA